MFARAGRTLFASPTDQPPRADARLPQIKKFQPYPRALAGFDLARAHRDPTSLGGSSVELRGSQEAHFPSLARLFQHAPPERASRWCALFPRFGEGEPFGAGNTRQLCDHGNALAGRVLGTAEASAYQFVHDETVQPSKASFLSLTNVGKSIKRGV